MAKKNIFTTETLEAMGLKVNPDGSYSKAKTVQQPREKSALDRAKEIIENPKRPTEFKVKNINSEKFIKDKLEDIIPKPEYHSIRLVLMGEPMAKQSVRATKSGHFFQPKKYVDREKDYRRQIAEQLPAGFKMFTEEVKITKLHFLYAPLKGFQKIKGHMERIRNGELIPKTTRPDLMDNLKKILADSFSGIVWKDDSIVCGEDNVRKYYSTGGCVVIELEGK